MHLNQLINLNTVYIDAVSQSKMAVLLKLSQLLCQNHPNLNPEELFEAYWKRESLGSTAIGQGITIPHVRTTYLEEPIGCVIRLLNPVDFGATDKQPIDLVIGLLVPQEQTEQHLKILAAIVDQFRAPTFREACRRASNQEELYHFLISHEELSEPA
ncbi:PTS sugar transporter subunit IIA [Legionella micdadei]|uniref:PTS IIA-like nitrogen-regulatory protein PtsN n=1 Tax=Legionella micdadei TaxID=451 RepID=A0A098GCD8_LEGMI|nr:PTS sugar transporter subunit IIA [Legionella micdadei]ARG98198.1 hypothetical protein B6N58_11325 [Legionella micdadei]ARH00993.1 hypothetical protein B6V88_11555 [Legionella micdadei]KTD29975.1 Nitrogen regulatory protein [Legionella micdadei]NSL18967.1 PTS sugar transporter subunit IIA [Legionella micdadei]CEG60143.1 putative Nitrogen regulatory protein [Includes: Phosphotransferase enzyme IIA component] [Legionella micdadei]